ncbi:unnamed protein product [Closterium sp. Naga37s-1]|nr:unnamed protein product [Closterium sp. Naga37s-1]
MALRPLAAFARDWLKRAPALALLAAALLALALRFGLYNSSGCDPCGGDSEGDDDVPSEPLAHFTDSRTGSPGATSDAAALVASWMTPGSEGEGAPARTRFHISNYGFPGPVPWRFVRQRVREQFTLGGRIALVCWWHSKSKPGSVAKSFVWSTDDIEARAAQARARDPALGSYGPNVTAAFLAAFERYPVSGKSVLVIGSRSPWVESICLGFDAEAITTVDFNKPVASHPKMRQMLVDELEGTDEVFDVAVSFSSLEHDGLGRYGDPINPFGDLQRMQKKDDDDEGAAMRAEEQTQSALSQWEETGVAVEQYVLMLGSFLVILLCSQGKQQGDEGIVRYVCVLRSQHAPAHPLQCLSASAVCLARGCALAS